MKFKLIEGGDKTSVLNKLNAFAKDNDVKTVAFAMWGKPLLYVGYEEMIEEYVEEGESFFEEPSEEEKYE